MKNTMEIKHQPQFNEESITKHYTEKDGVPVRYVCTTDLKASDVPVDVYYRETPHPEFGNHYFGLYYDHIRDHMMITDADIVEELEFGMIEQEGTYHYSQSHHDYKVLDNGKMIDGGRVYIRSNGCDIVMRIIDGKFYPADIPDLIKAHKSDLNLVDK